MTDLILHELRKKTRELLTLEGSKELQIVIREDKKKRKEEKREKKEKQYKLMSEIDELFNSSFKSFTDTFTTCLKTKKTKRYLFEAYDINHEMEYSTYLQVISNANTYINFSQFNGKSKINVKQENKNNTTTEYSKFGNGIASLIQLILKKLLAMKMPYKRLKVAVQKDAQILEWTSLLINIVTAFPVKTMYFEYNDERHYLFILPGYDILELEVPILLPNLTSSEFTTNTCFNMFYEKTDFYYSHEKVYICQLMNRCTLPLATYEDLKEVPIKLNKVVLAMCERVKGIIDNAEKTIFAFMCKVKVQSSIRQRRCKNLLSKSKFIYWSRGFIKYTHFLQQQASTITGFFKTQLKRYKRKYNTKRKLIECLSRKFLLSFDSYNERLPWLRFREIPIWFDSCMTFTLLQAALHLKESNEKKEKEMNEILNKTYMVSNLEETKKDTEESEKNGKEKDSMKIITKSFEESATNELQFKYQSFSKGYKFEKNPNILVQTTKELWFGFKRNEMLNNLIISVGETLDILEIVNVEWLNDNCKRVKSCLGKICAITKSKQYIKFCRHHSRTRKLRKNENIFEFYKCFGNCLEFDLDDALKEICLFSQICQNKWFIFALNNVDKLLNVN